MTPLENYLKEKFNGKIEVSDDVAIIGSDNDYPGGDLLLPLYKAYEGEKPSVYPNCLAAYLLCNGLPWNEKNNKEWMDLCVKKRDLNTFSIAHIKINLALQQAVKNGVISLERFQESYKGNKNLTYLEVLILLENGYHNYTEIHFHEIPYAQLRRNH